MWMNALMAVVTLSLPFQADTAQAQVAEAPQENYTVQASGGANVHPLGEAPFLGALNDLVEGGDAVDFVSTNSGEGYWLVSDTGVVNSFGDAPDLGDLKDYQLNQPIVGIAVTPTTLGYWLVAADGGIFSFGDADFYGSTGDIVLNAPIVGMLTSPSGDGYWLVATDGGVFAFGDAKFYGSAGSLPLNAPVTTILPSAGGAGYLLSATDGGVFAYGDATFSGSTANLTLETPIVDGAPTTTGLGYWLVTAGGTVHTFGDASDYGSVVATGDEPIVAIAARPQADGVWLLSSPSGRTTQGPPVPANSGNGRRIIYATSGQRVWLVQANGRVFDSYLVSGKAFTPAPGTYSVYSKSPLAWAGHDGITMQWMVRFAFGRTLAIGFHGIPTYADGSPMQTPEQLGTYRSSGCIRQRVEQAKQLYDWAPLGTTVVVLA